MLDRNRIRYVDPDAFVGLGRLRELRLEENGLRSAANLQPLTSLQSLHMGSNRISEPADLERLAGGWGLGLCWCQVGWVLGGWGLPLVLRLISILWQGKASSCLLTCRSTHIECHAAQPAQASCFFCSLHQLPCHRCMSCWSQAHECVFCCLLLLLVPQP